MWGEAIQGLGIFLKGVIIKEIIIKGVIMGLYEIMYVKLWKTIKHYRNF